MADEEEDSAKKKETNLGLSSEQVKARLFENVKKRGTFKVDQLDVNAYPAVSRSASHLPSVHKEKKSTSSLDEEVLVGPANNRTSSTRIYRGEKFKNVQSEKQKLKDGGEYLEVKRNFPDLLESSKGGPAHISRAVISDDGSAVFQVLLKPHRTVKLFNEDDQFDVDAFQNLLDLFNDFYYFCVGASAPDFMQMSSNIHVVLKNKEHHKSPFERVTSTKCQVWFKGAKNMSKLEKKNGSICQECKSFFDM